MDFFNPTYRDNLGEGMFGYRHFIWIALTILLCFILYLVFKKHKKVGLILLISVSTFILIFRFTNQLYRGFAKIETPFLKVVPWHLCTVLSFLVPIIVIFNIKKLKTAAYSLAIMGGVVTLILGEYFDDKLLTMFTLEGMFTHSFLIIIPVIEVAIGRFSFNFKNSWQSIVGVLVLLLWATFANKVVFSNFNTNYMYLEENALPFSIDGIHFFVLYIFLYFIFFLAIFGLPTLYRKIKQKCKNTSTQQPTNI